MSKECLSEGVRQRLHKVIVYIQDNLDGKLSLEKVSSIANLSPYHFHRQFKSYSGENLHDYIKRLRLERAAFMINHSDTPITQMVYESGYETPSAFSKAFKGRFGVTPRGFRGVSLYEEKDAVQCHLQPEIKEVAAQTLLFQHEIGPYEQAAEKAWQRLMMMAYTKGLIDEHSRAIGIAYDSPYITDENHFRYDACLALGETDGKKIPNTQVLPRGRYAMFRHQGAYHQMDDVYDFIYGCWLIQSGHVLRDQPSFCHYHQMNSKDVPEEELVTDIYIPIE